jgi:Toprim-like/DNA primase catalytic core, N-terminal domain
MTKTFLQAKLPTAQKKLLCRDLLAEFGVKNITEHSNGELIHSCCLPFGQHKNGDRNPSASLNYNKLTYSCLGCGNSGGLLWFIAICRGEDSAQTRQWLESATGTEGGVLDLQSLLRLIDEIFEPAAHVYQPVPKYDPSLLDSWRHPNFHPLLTEGMPEIGIRGWHIPEETLRHFDIGYDLTTDRITIPVWWNGKLIGWQGRAVASDEDDKYKSSPELPKSSILYNYNKRDEYIVVESPKTVLCRYHHMPTMTATFGAKVGEAQQRLLHSARKVVLWYDNDKAGWSATRRLGNALTRYTTVYAVRSPWAGGPEDLPDAIAEQLVADAVPYAVWQIPDTIRRWRDTS